MTASSYLDIHTEFDHYAGPRSRSWFRDRSQRVHCETRSDLAVMGYEVHELFVEARLQGFDTSNFANLPIRDRSPRRTSVVPSDVVQESPSNDVMTRT